MPIASLIPVGAWLWDKYGGSITEKAAGTFKGEWDKFRWNTAAERYRAKIKKLYGTMQIMGMAEPVRLDDIFTDAYMLDKPTAFGRFDIERLKALSKDTAAQPSQAERINGLRLVREKGNLFILGKPGAGKTTFLKYLALQAAEQNIDKIPVFVTLRHWADSDLDLIPFINERFDICGFPNAKPFVEELLTSGNAIVLFDGLDEVNQENGQRDRQTRQINNFVEQYENVQCLITCRIAASDFSFEPFSYVEVADFTENQIEVFVGNWFRDEEGEKDKETSKRFLAEFSKQDNKGLRDLARTPLLLTLLCLAFNETLTFPQRRVEIYQEALDALLKKWDSSRRIKRDEMYRKLSVGHKENLLARIAAETFEKNEYFVPQPELERLITDYAKNVPPHDTNEATDGEAILKAIEAQHGIFVERARGVYSFSHLTFQEYFTARYIVSNSAKGTLTSLINEHCSDVRWREVFLLTTSLLPDASQFMSMFRFQVHKLLKGDDQLQALLVWAGKKSATIQGEPWVVRRFCLDLDFYGSRLIRELAKATSPDRVSNLGRIMSRLYALIIRRLIGKVHLSSKLELGELGNDLMILESLDNTSPDEEWQVSADKVPDMIRPHVDFANEWILTEAQANRLSGYKSASTLLQDCLELATMPPDEKKAMLNSLYLPPAEEATKGRP